MTSYKVIDVFGNETLRITTKKRRCNKSLFDDHDGFAEKFVAKKTTDDCYTPDPVYQIIFDYVSKQINLAGMEIVRPFYPGIDFLDIEYPENCIVIDNPPFSIITKIVRHYLQIGVKFFLFAPHLTLFGSDLDCTGIVVGADVVYENGATVKTSFLSNIFDDLKIMTEPEIFQAVKKYNKQKAQPLPKYQYPDNLVTVSMLQKVVENGVALKIEKSHCAHIRQLDDQKKHGKTVFGSGFLLSEKAVAEGKTTITFALSDRELKIIKSLGSVKLFDAKEGL